MIEKSFRSGMDAAWRGFMAVVIAATLIMLMDPSPDAAGIGVAVICLLIGVISIVHLVEFVSSTSPSKPWPIIDDIDRRYLG